MFLVVGATIGRPQTNEKRAILESPADRRGCRYLQREIRFTYQKKPLATVLLIFFIFFNAHNSAFHNAVAKSGRAENASFKGLAVELEVQSERAFLISAKNSRVGIRAGKGVCKELAAKQCGAYALKRA